jgi:hypothetical protein
MEPSIGALDPRNLRAQWLESGEADNHALAGIDHFNQLDLAALGGYVQRGELEAEAAELFHTDFMFHGTTAAPAAATLRPKRRLLSRDNCGRGNLGGARHERSSGRVGIRPQGHALHSTVEFAALQTH